MANSTNPLTNTQVAKAKPKDKEYNLSDGGGLNLRIKPSGAKIWLLNYTRPGTKKRTNMKLGVYPDFSLADARREREKYRGQLAKGNDPQEYKADVARRTAEANSNTFEAVAERWLKVHAKKKRITEDYAGDIWRSFELHVFPALGNRPIHKITPKEAKAALEPMEEAGKLETLGRVIQRINKVMNYAERNELIEANRLHQSSPAAMLGTAGPLPELSLAWPDFYRNYPGGPDFYLSCSRKGRIFSAPIPGAAGLYPELFL